MRTLIPVLEPGADRYAARGTRLALALFGAAWLALVAQEVQGRVWLAYGGDVCLRRVVSWPPLGPRRLLFAEWALEAAAGLLLLSGLRPRLAVRLGAALAVASAQQRYMSQKAALALMLCFLALDPPEPGRAGFEETDRPNLGLVVWQGAIIYAFSAFLKLRLGFLSGASLTNLFGLLAASRLRPWLDPGPVRALLAASPGLARALSAGVVGGEAVLAVLLFTRPRAALVGIVLLHAAFSAFMPDVLSYGLTMAGCAVLARARMPAGDR